MAGSAPHLVLLDNGSFYHERAAAVLDQEWALATTCLILELPNPFEDLDPNFIHKRWTTEVNTTRRTNHSARYQVRLGAFLASRGARSLKFDAPNHSLPVRPNFVVPSGEGELFTGPQGFHALTVRAALL
jgi:hypothetical protein